MKKRVIALLTAVCLAAAPMSVLAEDKEDYSYLEDMSVKELKELRDAINEILGEDGGSSDEEDIAAKHPEWDELDAESDPYYTAITLAQICKDSLTDKSSFQLDGVNHYFKGTSKDFYTVYYSGANQFGGMTSTYIVFRMRDGNLDQYYTESTMKNMSTDDIDEAFDIALDGRSGKIGDTLDAEFINYHLE